MAIFNFIFTKETLFSFNLLKGSFFILMIDDFHNINTIKTPQKTELSNAVHMATLLMDVQEYKPVLQPSQSIHREVKVQIPGRKQPQICRGGISDEAVTNELQKFGTQYFLNTFLETLPDNYKEINPCLLQTSLKEIR